MHTPPPGIRVTESESESATDSEYQLALAANFDRPFVPVGCVCPEGGRTVTPGVQGPGPGAILPRFKLTLPSRPTRTGNSESVPVVLVLTTSSVACSGSLALRLRLRAPLAQDTLVGPGGSAGSKSG